MDEKTSREIRQRAYEIFTMRRGGVGDALSDWLQAEQEIRSGERRRRHRGPAKLRDTRQWGHITEAGGHDIENPT